MNKMNLGGHIVGFAVTTPNGDYRETWLEQPIHNRIVKTGINQLLMYNGSTTGGLRITGDSGGYSADTYAQCYAMFRGNVNNHYGCIHFCRLGTGNTPTTFFDTDLESPIGEMSETIKTGFPYTDTVCNSAYSYDMFVTHMFPALETDVVISEIGYFGRFQSDSSDESTIQYPMFSRIVLDQPVTLHAGETFQCTYKLSLNLSDAETEITNFGGLPGQHAVSKCVPHLSDTYIGKRYEDIEYTSYDSPTADSWSSRYCAIPVPCITHYGKKYYPLFANYYRKAGGYRTLPLPQVSYKTASTRSGTYGSSEHVFLCTEIRPFSVPNDTNMSGGGNDTKYINSWINCERKNQNGTVQFVDYDPTKNYRDIILTLPTYNPDLTTVEGQDSIQMHGIYCRGMEFKLGYYDGDVWVPQPITKHVNESFTFVMRTSITTDDTDAWMSGTL